MLPAELLRQVRRLQVKARRAVQSLAGGEYAAAFKGTGLAFEDVREYQAGDDVRRIDWNVTARTGRTVLKRFVEERELTLLLAVDLSASLDFGSSGNTKRTVAAELAALLAYAAMANRDRVGFLGFTDRIERHVKPSRGPRHTARILRDILQYEPQHGGTDLAEVLREISRVYRRRAVVFVLSDFAGEDYASSFRHAARQHDLIAIRIQDSFEQQWPNLGLVQLEDAETGTPLLIDTASMAFRTAYETQAAADNEAFTKLVRGSKAEMIDVRTDGGHLDALVEFFHRRQRRRGT
ncbi:DUF58 domain-containing protein [soil metagenome]